MSSLPPHDEHEPPRDTPGHGPVRVHADADDPASASKPSPEHSGATASDAAASVISAAQDTAERLQVAAAELQTLTGVETAAARRLVREQRERAEELERARVAIQALMGHLETAQADVLKSTERIRRVVDDVARSIEEAADAQLRALRGRIAVAASAADLIASGVTARDEAEQAAAATPQDVAALDGSTADAASTRPAVRAEDTASPAAELLEETSPAADADASDYGHDDAGDGKRARLTAMNMALRGSPRDETALHLADRFDLADSDAAALLDEVYRVVEEAG